jgi:nucleotide-binding universal stress UspA family protein
MVYLHEEGLKRVHSRITEAVRKARDYVRDHAPGLRVTLATTVGRPHSVILKEAARWNADLIVLGSYGYGAIGRFLFGSVACAVARRARCSVEIVRGD